MSIGARPGLFTTPRGARTLALGIAGAIGWLALTTAGCNSYSYSGGYGAFGTGAFGTGAGQTAGSCPAVAAKLAECGLPQGGGCSSACQGECVLAASCSELDALFAGQSIPGPLQACLQACSGSTGSNGMSCETDSDCAEGQTCAGGHCTGSSSSSSSGGSGGSSSGSSGSASSSSGSSGSASSSSGSSGSASSSSGGLMHPECATYATEICGQCHGANPCGTGTCESCAASTCDEIYDQCSAWLDCQASTCGSSSCCGMPCSPC